MTPSSFPPQGISICSYGFTSFKSLLKCSSKWLSCPPYLESPPFPTVMHCHFPIAFVQSVGPYLELCVCWFACCRLCARKYPPCSSILFQTLRARWTHSRAPSDCRHDSFCERRDLGRSVVGISTGPSGRGGPRPHAGTVTVPREQTPPRFLGQLRTRLCAAHHLCLKFPKGHS